MVGEPDTIRRMNDILQDSLSVREVLVSGEVQGQRIDNYLFRLLKGVPKSRIYRILRRGEVRVNKGRVGAGYRLQPGDRVRIPPLRLSRSEAAVNSATRSVRDLETQILFEDERLLVLNKPAGMAVHGGSGTSFGVIEAVRALRPDAPHLELVHRLDRETSGCLLISKKRSALRFLHALLRENGVDKRYLALLAGAWPDSEHDVRAPLAKNVLRSGERIASVDPQGKEAHTRFRRLRAFQQATLVEARLFTGRTHQIRVHAAYIGHPVLGDTKYGDEAANRAMRGKGLRRLFLHARSIEFQWPGEARSFRVEAPLEPDLQTVLDSLAKWE